MLLNTTTVKRRTLGLQLIKNGHIITTKDDTLLSSIFFLEKENEKKKRLHFYYNQNLDHAWDFFYTSDMYASYFTHENKEENKLIDNKRFKRKREKDMIHTPHLFSLYYLMNNYSVHFKRQLFL